MNERMFVPDSRLTVPARDTRVWRYMDLAHFLSWLTSGTMWFARADTFEDTFEMAFPVADLPAAQADTAHMIHSGQFPREAVRTYLARFAGLPPAALEVLSEEDLARQILRHFGRFLFLSCWYQADYESAGMWDLYVRGRDGVAVQTTVGALTDVLDAGTSEYIVTLGQVEYLDYEIGSWGPYHAYSPAFHKRRSFEHERELRAAIVWPTYADLAGHRLDPASHPTPPGLAVPAGLAALAETIVVSPRADAFLTTALADLLSRYGLSQMPVRSTLYAPPRF